MAWCRSNRLDGQRRRGLKEIPVVQRAFGDSGLSGINATKCSWESEKQRVGRQKLFQADAIFPNLFSKRVVTCPIEFRDCLGCGRSEFLPESESSDQSAMADDWGELRAELK